MARFPVRRPIIASMYFCTLVESTTYRITIPESVPSVGKHHILWFGFGDSDTLAIPKRIFALTRTGDSRAGIVFILKGRYLGWVSHPWDGGGALPLWRGQVASFPLCFFFAADLIGLCFSFFYEGLC